MKTLRLRYQYLLFSKDNNTASLTLRIWIALPNILFDAMFTLKDSQPFIHHLGPSACMISGMSGP